LIVVTGIVEGGEVTVGVGVKVGVLEAVAENVLVGVRVIVGVEVPLAVAGGVDVRVAVTQGNKPIGGCVGQMGGVSGV
jgi:hypothetical protein